MLGEGLEGDHRHRALDAVELADVRGDDRGQVGVLLDVQDRDEVPLAGDGVDLADALDLGEVRAQRRDRAALGLDEDDRVGHSWCSPPGSRTATCAMPACSTSDL